MPFPSNLVHLQDAVRYTYRHLCHREPTSFEIGTADAMQRAFEAVVARESSGTPPSFEYVSCATGSGKTKAAEALLGLIWPHPTTIVVRELRQCNEVLRDLIKLLPEDARVAAWTSVHRSGSDREEALKGGMYPEGIPGPFTEDDASGADCIVTTHAAWSSAVRSRGPQWLLRVGDLPRIVVVDEDPDLGETFIAQPEHVAALVSTLADSDLPDHEAHPALPALRSIYERMADAKQAARLLTVLSSTELVSRDDVAALENLGWSDLVQRVDRLEADSGRVMTRRQSCRETIDFLRAAGEGRVFFSRGTAPAFHAWSMSVPAQPYTLVLDGTADLSGLLAASPHVHMTAAEKPSYAAVELFNVVPPKDFRGKLKPRLLLASSWKLRPFMEWFINDCLLSNTNEGEEILVYAKKRFLSFDLQREWDEGSVHDPHRTEYCGRVIHWSHFGSGRGSNAWKGCSVYFRISEFHPRRAVLLAKMCSMQEGRKLSCEDLKQLSSGATRHELYRAAAESHVVTHAKQDAARTCIRELDDSGACSPARLYMVDTDAGLMARWREAMFPGSSPYLTLDYSGPGEAASSGPQRMWDFLSTTKEDVVPLKTLADASGMALANLSRTLSDTLSGDRLASEDWRLVPLKEALGSGRGKCLLRRAA